MYFLLNKSQSKAKAAEGSQQETHGPNYGALTYFEEYANTIEEEEKVETEGTAVEEEEETPAIEETPRTERKKKKSKKSEKRKRGKVRPRLASMAEVVEEVMVKAKPPQPSSSGGVGGVKNVNVRVSSANQRPQSGVQNRRSIPSKKDSLLIMHGRVYTGENGGEDINEELESLLTTPSNRGTEDDGSDEEIKRIMQTIHDEIPSRISNLSHSHTSSTLTASKADDTKTTNEDSKSGNEDPKSTNADVSTNREEDAVTTSNSLNVPPASQIHPRGDSGETVALVHRPSQRSPQNTVDNQPGSSSNSPSNTYNSSKLSLNYDSDNETSHKKEGEPDFMDFFDMSINAGENKQHENTTGIDQQDGLPSKRSPIEGCESYDTKPINELDKEPLNNDEAYLNKYDVKNTDETYRPTSKQPATTSREKSPTINKTDNVEKRVKNPEDEENTLTKETTDATPAQDPEKPTINEEAKTEKTESQPEEETEKEAVNEETRREEETKEENDAEEDDEEHKTVCLEGLDEEEVEETQTIFEPPPKPKWHPPWQLKQEIIAHADAIPVLKIDPTNRWFATGSADTTVRIWDINNGKEKLLIKAHKRGIRSMTFGMSGHRQLFTTSDDRQLLCHDVEMNRVVSQYKGQAATVYDMCTYQPSQLLVIGARDKMVKVYDTRTTKCVKTLRGHLNTVSCVATNENTKQIVSGSHDGTLRLWDIGQGRCMNMLQGHTKSVRAITMHPVNNLILSASTERILAWTLPNGQLIQEIPADDIGINSICVNHLGVTVAGGSNGLINLWDFKSGHKFQRISRTKVYESQEIPITVFATRFDLSGTKLICSDACNIVKIYKEAYTKIGHRQKLKQACDFVDVRTMKTTTARFK